MLKRTGACITLSGACWRRQGSPTLGSFVEIFFNETNSYQFEGVHCWRQQVSNTKFLPEKNCRNWPLNLGTFQILSCTGKHQAGQLSKKILFFCCCFCFLPLTSEYCLIKTYAKLSVFTWKAVRRRSPLCYTSEVYEFHAC